MSSKQGSIKSGLPRLEKSLGGTLPRPLNDYFRRPRELEHLQEPKASGVDVLERVFPKLPLRVLPVFATHAGNLLGVYWPRSGTSPVAVAFYKDEYILSVLTADLDRFFGNPDLYSHDHPKHRGNAPPEDLRASTALRISPRATCAELELLKPLYFHYRDLERCEEGLFKGLWKRFGTADPRGDRIRKTFRTPAKLHDRKAWLTLADGFARSGFSNEAICALENCHAVQSVVGYRVKGKACYHSLDWKDDLEVFERLKPLISEHGDALDQVLVPRMIESAREYIRR